MSLALHAWIAIAVVFYIGEILSPGMLLLPFGLGATVAALLEITGRPTAWQWIAFVGVSSAVLLTAQRVRKRRRRD